MVPTLSRDLDGTHPLVVIETDDETELREALFAAMDSSFAYRRWSAVHGVVPARLAENEPIADTEQAVAALVWLTLHGGSDPSVTVFFDLGAHLTDPRTLRALKEAIAWARLRGSVLVLVERSANLPDAIQAEAHHSKQQLPNDEELEAVVRETVRNVSKARTIEASIRRTTLSAIARSMRGLTRRQARSVITASIVEDNAFNDKDLEQVMLHKRNACADLDGVLEFVQAPVSMDRVGGLQRLKSWLAARELSSAVEAEQFGLSLPRGVLLLGVQGAGKSLAAKAVATAWRVPLLRLDAGALFDKFVGESERKLRDSLAQADRMAPAVLWIDEIEKGFASASSVSSDGGLSRRMFGTLLTWMQERTAGTFLVATANDISALPPELLRKGRFDEIFFVDLPDAPVRRMIFGIHLTQRKRVTTAFDMDSLITATNGFSGAEIEAGIESALRVAFADGRRDLTTEDLVAAYEASPPISVIMADRMTELRAWSRGRCVPAD